MRVLHLYAGNLYGGIETFLVTLAHHGDRGGSMESHFALCFPGRLRDELLAAGVPVHDLGSVRMRWPWTVWRARNRLRRLLRTVTFDVVVCHSSWPHAVFAPVVRQAGLPLVLHIHGPIGRPDAADRLASRTVPDVAIGVSRDTARSVRGLFPGVPVEVLHYPLPWDRPPTDASDRLNLRTSLDTPSDATVIVQVSRLDRWKGHPDHLSALGKLKQLPGWVCWIVGGPQRPAERQYLAELKRQAETLGISDRVRFVGARNDIPRLLAAADIFCQTNRGPEGFSLAFMEAFTAGLPIVTTDIGGAPELIDSTCGYLVPVGDAPAVARSLEELIRNPDRRRAMGEAGAARVRRLCDRTVQFDSFRSILTSACPAPSATGRPRGPSATVVG